jgi:hypothetical protein
MPLLDHFHEPIDPRAEWPSFNAYWATAIGRGLNRMLPPRFFAAVNLHQGSQVAADIAEYDLGAGGPGTTATGGGIAALQPYVVPVVTGTAPGISLDQVELPVVDTDDGRLVAVVELVSPANKDRPENRGIFAAKCAAYLAEGLGLVVIDVVGKHHFNLHDEIADILRWPAELMMAESPDIYVASYRPKMRGEVPENDFWAFPLAVGRELPVVPFALKGWGCVPLNLEESYAQTCRDSRLGAAPEAD